MSGPTLAYEIVDVFTDTAFSGNPLAVVLDADDLTTAQMQALAAEFYLSETAFPTAPPAGATYGLRIFTPTTELAFAGHPSVGSAWVLHRLGRIPAGDVVQACGAGLLPVTVSAAGATLAGARASYGEPLDPGPALEALGLSADDLVGVPPREAGVGLDFLFLMVRPEALATAQVDSSLMVRLGVHGVSLVAWDGVGARVRLFPGRLGNVEDPATGSAAMGLGVFLAASGLVADGVTDYVVRQGVEMGRPSTLTCQVEVAAGLVVRTSVTGSVVPVARGEIRVPPA